MSYCSQMGQVGKQFQFQLKLITTVKMLQFSSATFILDSASHIQVTVFEPRHMKEKNKRNSNDEVNLTISRLRSVFHTCMDWNNRCAKFETSGQ